MKNASNESFGYTEDEIVSSDVVGMTYGSLFSNTTVNSVNEPVATGTRCAPPSNLPSISGITLPINSRLHR
jgi:hypothetical protein